MSWVVSNFNCKIFDDIFTCSDVWFLSHNQALVFYMICVQLYLRWPGWWALEELGHEFISLFLIGKVEIASSLWQISIFDLRSIPLSCESKNRSRTSNLDITSYFPYLIRTLPVYSFFYLLDHLIWLWMLVLWRSFAAYGHQENNCICCPISICAQSQILMDHGKIKSALKDINSRGSPEAINNFIICADFTSSRWNLSLCVEFRIALNIQIYFRAFDIFPLLASLFASMPRTTLYPASCRFLVNWHIWLSKSSWISGSWIWCSFWKYLTWWFHTEVIPLVFLHDL